MQQWLAQFDFSDWKDWIVPLIIVGGSVLGSITKAIHDRTAAKKDRAEKVHTPKVAQARPVNRDIPVARARSGPVRGPLDRSSPAPLAARPRPSMRRTARPLPPALRPDQAAPSSSPPPPTPVARRLPDTMQAPHPVAKALWEVMTGSGEAQVQSEQSAAGPEPGEALIPPLSPVLMPSAGASRPPEQVPKQRRKRPSKRRAGTTRLVHPLQTDKAEKPDDPFAVSLPSWDPHAPASVTPDDMDDLALIRRPTRAALRRAIIMNEILAPPIALREPDDRV